MISEQFIYIMTMMHPNILSFLPSLRLGVGRGQGRGRTHAAAQAHRQERELLPRRRQQPSRHRVQRQVTQVN